MFFLFCNAQLVYCQRVKSFASFSFKFSKIATAQASGGFLQRKNHIFATVSPNLLISRLNFRYFEVIILKDKYPNFEVGLKCIIMVF